MPARLLLVAALALVDAQPAGAQTLSVRGFIDGRALFYPQTTEIDRVRNVGEARGRVETFWRPAPWLRFAGGVDARMDTHDQVDRSWRVDWDDRRLAWPTLALRRAAVTISRGPVSVDLGKQFIRWGKADILNPVDRFAPRDFLNVVSDEFLAITGARVVYQRGSETIDIAWVPRFTPTRIPLFTQRWGGTGVGLEAWGLGLDGPLVPAIILDEGARYPDGDQIGARWSHVGARFELSGSAYRGFNHLPLIDVVFSPSLNRVTLQRRYPTMRMAGVDAAVPLRWLTLKGEVGYFTTTTPGTDEYGLYVVQAERQSGEWSLVGGYAGEFVTRRAAAASFAPDRGLSRAFVARAGYTIDVNRSASVETVIQRRAAVVKGEYTQAVGQHWRATAAGVWLRSSDASFLGRYRRNSHVTVTLRFSF